MSRHWQFNTFLFLNIYFIQLHVLERWIYYRCLLKKFFWKHKTLCQCFLAKIWNFSEWLFKVITGGAAYVLPLLLNSVNLLSYDTNYYGRLQFNQTLLKRVLLRILKSWLILNKKFSYVSIVWKKISRKSLNFFCDFPTKTSVS